MQTRFDYFLMPLLNVLKHYEGALEYEVILLTQLL